MFALGIRHVGESTAKTLADWLGSLERIRRAPAPLLRLLPDIGSTVAASLAEFLAEPHNQQVINDFLALGVKPQGENAPNPALCEKLTPAALLAALEIPKLSAARCNAVATSINNLAELTSFSLGRLQDAGLPKDVAQSFFDWLHTPAAQNLPQLDTLRTDLLSALPVADAVVTATVAALVDSIDLDLLLEIRSPFSLRKQDLQGQWALR